MKLVLTILILTFGIVGNAINTLIFAKKIMRSSPTFRFLLYLSIADAIVLIMGMNEILLKSDYSFGLRDSSLFVCNIQKFISYSSTHMSSCLSIVVNVYRANFISNLTYKKRNIIKKRVRFQTTSLVDAISTIIFVIVFALNSHFILFLKPFYPVSFGEDLKSNETSMNAYHIFRCVPYQNSFYEYFLVHAWFWIDLLIFSIIPFVFMAPCSIIILHNIKRLNKENSLTFLSEQNSNKFVKRNLREKIQLSLMLISSNVYFLLTMVIFWTWFLIENRFRLNRETFETHSKRSMAYALLFSNNAFGKFFYSIFSTQYRIELNRFLNKIV